MIISGLIIYMDKNSVTVMTKDNAYYKLRRKPTMYISQKIEFKHSEVINSEFYVKRILGLVACICIMVGSIFYFGKIPFINLSESQEFAYIGLDINPSMEFSIDNNEKIMAVEYINSDASRLFTDLNLIGMKADKAFLQIIDKLDENKIVANDIDSYFVISGCMNTNSNIVNKDLNYSEYKFDRLLNRLKSEVGESGVSADRNLVLKLEYDDREEAKAHGVSMGQYALYSKLNKLGKKISIEEVKSTSIRDLVKEYAKLKIEKESAGEAASAVPPSVSAIATNTSVQTRTPSPEPNPEQTPQLTMDGSAPPVLTPKKNPTPVPTAKPSHTPTMSQATIPNLVQTPQITQAGTGLSGEYYNNIDLTSLKLVRVDPQVNFDWGVGVPDFRVRDDESYSVRWTGQIQSSYSEEFVFYVTRDNGARLWIDDKLIVDKWDSGWNMIDTGTVDLEAGKKYNIKLEFFNNVGNGKIKLEWSSNSVQREIIPKKCLYPSAPIKADDAIPGDGIGINCEYYDYDNLTSLKYKGMDSTINFDWGNGSPLRTVKQDQNFSIRWTGKIQPVYSEDYTFYVTHDDGVRLWINNKLVIDKWVGGNKTVTQTEKITLEADKKYNIKVEYFNKSQAGVVKLEWSSKSTKRSLVPKTRLYP